MTRDPEANESETRADTREKTLQSRMMSEMRQHLIRMNREKMIEVKKYEETGFLFPIDVVGAVQVGKRLFTGERRVFWSGKESIHRGKKVCLVGEQVFTGERKLSRSG